MFGAYTGDGGEDGDKPTGPSLNTENPQWPTLNRDTKSFKRFQIISKVYPEP